MIEIKVALRPFDVPDYVYEKGVVRPRGEGWTPPIVKHHLSELDADTLTKMCDEFRGAIFKKAREAKNEST